MSRTNLATMHFTVVWVSYQRAGGKLKNFTCTYIYKIRISEAICATKYQFAGVFSNISKIIITANCPYLMVLLPTMSPPDPLLAPTQPSEPDIKIWYPRLQPMQRDTMQSKSKSTELRRAATIRQSPVFVEGPRLPACCWPGQAGGLGSNNQHWKD